MKNIDLSIREIDDLLQHLYLKLKGKKEGLSLVEPAAILLARLKSANPAFYAPQLARFTPIIMDALISHAYVSFGYEGLESLYDVAGNISLATGDYIPAGVEEGLSGIRREIDSINAVLSGESTDAGIKEDNGGDKQAGTGGFFRERAWCTVGLPLVSTYNTGKTPFSTGRVIKARVEIRITGEWSLRTKHAPVINFEHISAEPNSPFERQIHTAIRVAEEYAVAAMGMKGMQRVPREYWISLPEIASFPASAIQRLSGGSAGLAIAALLISILSKLDLSRYRLNIEPCSSFTGMVDEDGRILAVEDSHIADKVRAVFYSRYSRLVLPEGNLETARKQIAILSKEHPARKLDLIPVSAISDIVEGPGVIKRHRTPAGKPILQRLFMWRKHLIAALTPVVLAVMILFILPPYLDRQVTDVSILGEQLVMKNKYGRQVSRHDVGFDIGTTSQNSKIYYHDIDEAPGVEILAIMSESRKMDSRKTRFNRLHFLVFSDDGRLLHDRIYNPEKIMGSELDSWAFEKTILMISSNAVFLDEYGKGIVVVGIHFATYTPATLVRADLSRGTFKTFFHKGFFREMVPRDLDGDGKREIVLAGYNLPLDASIIAVIDPATMNGSSPLGFCYKVSKMDADIAKYYVRLPEFRLSMRRAGLMYPFGVSILENSDTLKISIKSRAEDVRYSIVGNMRVVKAEVVLSHGMGMNRPDSISTFDYPGKEQDEKDLLGGIHYWDGEDWVTEPTINRSYLAQIDEVIVNTITQVDHIGNRLVMKGVLGNIIASYDAGFGTRRSGAYRKIFFGDFLSDEGDEILCALCNSQYPDKSEPERNKLFILIFDEKGQLLRKHVYHEESIMGSEMERTAHRISMQMIRTSSPFSEEFGPGLLFIGTHHKTEPPASIIRFSLDDGLYETFFHKGFLQEMAAKDIDGDGKNELLMTGYNSSLKAAVIVVLDPDHVGGSSPPGTSYSVPGSELDIAKYYIKLPFYHRLEEFITRAWSLHTCILENGDSLKIILRSRAEDIIFTIGNDMTFTDAEVVQSYYEGRDCLIPATFPEKEEDEKKLLAGVRFWDGENWVAEPTVNRSYLRHVKAGSDTLAVKGK